jgi:hypothetical protein
MAKETPVERVQIQAIGRAMSAVTSTAAAMPRRSGSFQWRRISPAA